MRKYRKALPFRVKMLLVFLAAALAVGGTVLFLHAIGFRYTVCHRTDGTDVRFVGRINADGAQISGVVKFPDGTSATVDKKDGSFHYSNGSVYYGRLNSVFEREGTGKLILESGDVYEGNFEADRLSGKGKYTFANGDVYEGDFVSNVKSGQGKYVYADGEVYEGGFLGDTREGEGRMTKPDGSSYTGGYHLGLKTGTGKFVYANEDVYEGEFANDMRHGKGVYVWADGERYEGDFEFNNINGYGTYEWTDGRASYTGWFKNGEIVIVDPSAPAEKPSESGETANE